MKSLLRIDLSTLQKKKKLFMYKVQELVGLSEETLFYYNNFVILLF